MAIADALALLDPQLVALGGGMIAAQGERFVAPIREFVHGVTPVRTPIVLSSLGEDAQIAGAIRLALDKLEGAE